NFNFHIPANAVWFSVIAGILVSLDRDGGLAPAAASYPVKIISLFSLFFVLGGAWFFGLSDFFLWKAKTSEASASTTVMKHLDQSIRINPFNEKSFYARGITKETTRQAQSAAEDFKRASALNRLEPYHDYHRLKNLFLIQKI